MSHCYDIKKIENHDALIETPCDEYDEKQRRVSNYMSTFAKRDMSVRQPGICDVASRNTSPEQGAQLRSMLNNAMSHYVMMML